MDELHQLLHVGARLRQPLVVAARHDQLAGGRRRQPAVQTVQRPHGQLDVLWGYEVASASEHVAHAACIRMSNHGA